MIYTIGYEGATLDAFLKALQENGVDHIVDVRLTPLSRRRGFSKRQLAAALRRLGIIYSHHPELGCPKDVRVQYSRTGDFEWYTRAYVSKVLTRRAHFVSELAEQSRHRRVCLLCFEADANRCHRSLVAAMAAEANRNAFGFRHLAVAA